MRTDESAQAEPHTGVSPRFSERPNSLAIMEEQEGAVRALQLAPVKLHFQDSSQLAGQRDCTGFVILCRPGIEENMIVFEAHLGAEEGQDFPFPHPSEVAHRNDGLEIIGKSIAHESVVIVYEKSFPNIVLLQHREMRNESQPSILFGEVEHASQQSQRAVDRGIWDRILRALGNELADASGLDIGHPGVTEELVQSW